jgi:hypothetical protein
MRMPEVRAFIDRAWGAIRLTSVIFPLVAGGLGGALYNHWVMTRPADIVPGIADYGLIMGKPLLGLPIVLPNRGHTPGVVTEIELDVVSDSENRRTEIILDSVFTSGQLDIFNVANSGKLTTAGDVKLTLFVPLTVGPGQSTSALVWFQPRSRDFLFESSIYRCTGKLIVFSGKDKNETAIPHFAFAIDQDQADALNQQMQRNVLLPIKMDRQ